MANFTDSPTHHHHRLRGTLALVAAMAGGLGFLGLAFLLLGTVSPGRALWLWVAAALLLAVWLTGIVWRRDAPDGRHRQFERERRGF